MLKSQKNLERSESDILPPTLQHFSKVHTVNITFIEKLHLKDFVTIKT